MKERRKTQFYLTLESYKDADFYLNRLNEGSDFTVSVGIRYRVGYHLER